MKNTTTPSPLFLASNRSFSPARLRALSTPAIRAFHARLHLQIIGILAQGLVWPTRLRSATILFRRNYWVSTGQPASDLDLEFSFQSFQARLWALSAIILPTAIHFKTPRTRYSPLRSSMATQGMWRVSASLLSLRR